MEEKTENKSKVKIRDLTIGEHEAMQMASNVWGLLREMDLSYLRAFIVRMERDNYEHTKLSLPVFKMVLFFSEHMQEHCRKDEGLAKALKEQQEKNEREDFMEGVQIVP